MATNFYLNRSRTDKKGECQIRLSVCINTEARLLTTVGLSVPPSAWEETTQSMRLHTKTARGMTASTVNTRLGKIRKHFEDYENDNDYRREEVTANELRLEFQKNFGSNRGTLKTPSDLGEVIACLDEFVRMRGKQKAPKPSDPDWAKNTYDAYQTLRMHLITFGGNSLRFSKFTENGLDAFIDYLRSTRGMQEHSVSKNYNCLHTFLTWAIAKRLCRTRAIQEYKPEFFVPKNDVVFLEWDELMKLYNYQVPETGTMVRLTDAEGREYKKRISNKATLEAVRDCFCFSAFTSLRFSDMSALRKSDINWQKDSIHVVIIKTGTTVDIDLNDYSRALLRKYSTVDIPGGRALPAPKIAIMDKGIKDLGELLGFNTPVMRKVNDKGAIVDASLPKYQLLGSHTARRTFICNMLSLGVSPQVVMKFSGHSTYQAMQPYIDITSPAKRKAMDVFNKA